MADENINVLVEQAPKIYVITEDNAIIVDVTYESEDVEGE